MSFVVVTQFALLVFPQKWKFVLQRIAHSTSSQGLSKRRRKGEGALTDMKKKPRAKESTKKES